jgi:two-component sensor histidine kinase/ligand-binding sensor domain-containing protein
MVSFSPKGRSLSPVIVFLFFFTLFSAPADGQTFDFISYGVEEGLSQSEARCAMQDSRGMLWVGTAGGGVCSFDGSRFHEYGQRDGLAGQMVFCMAEDSAGNLWFGTNTGVSRYDGKKFSMFDRTGPGLDETRAILPKKDVVWIGVPSGIFEHSADGKMKRVATLENLTSLCLDQDGITWAGAGHTLYRFGSNDKDPVALDLGAGVIHSLCSDQHGLIYIGLDNRLMIYNSSVGTFVENSLTEMLSGKDVSDISYDHNGMFWVATMNNLVIKYAAPGTITRYDKSNGLEAESVYHIAEDNTHHIWMATREQSLLKLRSEAFTYFGNVAGMGSTTVFRILEDHAGRMWIGSNQDGLYYYKDNRSVPVLNNGKPFSHPVALVEDARQQMWVGHLNGVACLVNDRPVKQLLPGERVRALLADSKGNLWIGTFGHGVYVYNGSTMTHYTAQQNDLPGEYVHAIYEDKKGNIWLGTNNGLSCYNGKNFTPFGIDDGLCNTYVGSITEDQYGNIWFHTDACIMRYDGKKFMSYTDANGLASNTFYLIAFDAEGRLWAGTNKGIDRVTLNKEGHVLSVKNFSRNEGFRGIECNSRAVCLSRDGCLWFGTVKGVIRYDPAREPSSHVQPPVHINSIRLFLEPTDWTKSGVAETGWYHLPAKLELDHSNNHLTFFYEAINLQNPQSTRYRFMLAGFDSTWQPVTSATEITYANLPPGQYVFRVMASDGEEVWNPEPAVSGLITIAPPPPPFWLQPWFIIFSIVAFGGVLYWIIEGRTRRIRRQKELLEQEVRERTAEISRQNEEKTLMLKEIHHRVKNNLQVISSLLNLQAEGIQDKRVLALFEDGRHRVNSMALIHEKMYQSKNLVNIDIRNYIDELVRSLIDAYDSNKNIHLHTEIEDHLFRIDTIVPLGLILNEIISNAMKYAFTEMEDGELRVSLRKTGPNRFMLEVGDNGKGIPATINFEDAESLGMQLILMLSDQINGKATLLRGTGTTYRIEFVEETKDRF